MNRSIFSIIVAILFATPTLVSASDELIRHTRLEFGYAIGADGKKQSLRGIPLTIKLVPVEAKALNPQFRKELQQKRALKSTAFGRTMDAINHGPLAGITSSAPAPFMAETYVSDGGQPYFYLDPAEWSDPSSLDSFVMVGASGKLLQSFKFGLHAESSTNRVLFRFKLFQTYNPSAPAGTSAFSNIIGPNERGDAGFYIDNIPANAPGEGYMVVDQFGNPVNISNLGLTFPTNTVHMAMQWREPHLVWNPILQRNVEDGEGAFNNGMFNLYSTVAPSLGTSEDNFWYDWDPQDGIYTNEEYEVLGGISGTTYPSNFFLRVAVDSNAQTDTVLPSGFERIKGRNLTGTFTDLWTSNDVYVQLQPTLFAQVGVAPIQIRFESFAQSPNAISMSFNVESASLGGGCTQKILLKNYSTGQWDLKSTKTIGGTDGNTEVLIQTNAAHYINPADNKVEVRVECTPGTFSTATWRVRFDRVVWFITR